MNHEPTWKCECCGTEYFEPLAECDWCPEVKPQPLASLTEEESA